MQAARFLALSLFVPSALGTAQLSSPTTRNTAAIVELAPHSSPIVQRQVLASAKEPVLSQAAKLKLLREKVKYVFVLFQENRSFDFYFATYPGADGLYSHAANDRPAGFMQPIVNLDGSVTNISPFKIPFTVTDANGQTVPLYPSDVASVNHSHTAIAHKLALDANLVAQNNRYSLTEEGVTLDADGKPSKIPSLERKQFGELVLAHIDCDAAPFLWQYADRFTLFDHFFDTVIGPSTPNAIAMISGQSGETQWMLHPESSSSLPVLSDPAPYWGSLLDTKGDHPRQPNPEAAIKSESATNAESKPKSKAAKAPAPNLTFATLPLSFMGSEIEKTTAADYDPTFDLTDVREDIKKIAGHGVAAVNWGWYQQGYDHEPTDPTAAATHGTYVVHHNAPQYFGYVANNPDVIPHMRGLGDFFTDISAHRLPTSGVFYVRGGYGNIFGNQPLDPNPNLATVFNGDDDHPGYSDSQLSESLLAREINAIARSPYWSQSVILIAYDESDGFYDHARPRVRSHDPAGLPLDQGPRIPSILISPYAVAHGVSHELVEHSSIIKLVNELFNLIPLADLPDEERARAIGLAKYGQKDLGPADDKVEGVGDLLSGFDNLRLLGRAAPLPAAYAQIPEAEIEAYPHYRGQGCAALQIRPTDTGLPNPIPADFNPRPDTTPGIPTSGHWIP